MDNNLKIIECVIDTEIFEKLSTYRFKIIEFSPKLIGLRAIIGIVNNKVVACAIIDNSRTIPDKIFYEIFYCFDKEVDNINKEISFLESNDINIQKNKNEHTLSNKYKYQIKELESIKSYFRYNEFYYIVFLESLISGCHYGTNIVEYIKNKYKNIVTLPYPREVSIFWEHQEFKEIYNLYYYKK